MQGCIMFLQGRFVSARAAVWTFLPSIIFATVGTCLTGILHPDNGYGLFWLYWAAVLTIVIALFWLGGLCNSLRPSQRRLRGSRCCTGKSASLDATSAARLPQLHEHESA